MHRASAAPSLGGQPRDVRAGDPFFEHVAGGVLDMSHCRTNKGRADHAGDEFAFRRDPVYRIKLELGKVGERAVSIAASDPNDRQSTP